MAFNVLLTSRQLLPFTHSRLLATASTSASSSSPLFPYPSHPRPTPHQIFHLPHNASQTDIKLRYYDLVRVHHPDSPHCRLLSPAERHSRFQSIRTAYDALRGANLNNGFNEDPFAAEIARRKRAYHAQHARRAEYAYQGRPQWNASSDDRWKDRLILLAGVVTLAVGLAPGLFLLPFKVDKHHRAAVSNLSQARNDAKDYGDERRTELRKRVRDIKAGKDLECKDNQESHGPP